MNHHQSANVTAVVEMEMTTDVAISFAHSQYDKQVHSQSAECRIEMTLLVSM